MQLWTQLFWAEGMQPAHLARYLSELNEIKIVQQPPIDLFKSTAIY